MGVCNYINIGCFAHCLNLAAQKALKVDAVSRLLARVRKVVGYFHRSTTAAALLKNKIKLLGLSQLKLIQDVPTRWNSAADMLERYLLLQPAIYATLVGNELNQQPDVSTLSEADGRLAVSIMECLPPPPARYNNCYLYREDTYSFYHNSSDEEDSAFHDTNRN